MQFIKKNIFNIVVAVWMLMPIFAIVLDLVKAGSVFYVSAAYYVKMQNFDLIFFIVSALTGFVFMFCFFEKYKEVSKISIKQLFKKNIWIFFFLMFYIWLFLSCIFSDDIGLSFSGDEFGCMGFITYVIFLMLFFIIYLFKSRIDIKNIFNVLLFSGTLTSIVLLWCEKDFSFLKFAFYQQCQTAFYNANHTGYFLNLVVIVAAGLFIFEDNKKIKILYAVLLAFNFYTLIVNNTFGGILAAYITSIVMILFYFLKNRKMKIEAFVPFIILTALIICSCLGLIPSSTNQTMLDNIMSLFSDASKISSNSNVESVGTNRGALWKHYLSHIPKQPVFGIGLQTPCSDALEGKVASFQPANEFISYAAFDGIPTLVFYLLGFLSLAINRVKNIKEVDSNVLIAAGIIITYLISSFFGVAMFYTNCYLVIALAIVMPSLGKNVYKKKLVI